MRKRTAYASGVIVLLFGGLVALFVFGNTVKWVGRTDIEIRFFVSEAETGQPIPNASIHIRAEAGGYCDDAKQPQFTITTDEEGQARQLAKNCMCFGSKGLFDDTFGSHLPNWTFHTTASGYVPADPAYLNVSENARQVQRGDPFATLSIPIQLRKDAAQQPDEPER